jgi:transposase-like protein
MVKQTVEEKRPHTHFRDCPSCRTSIEYWWTSGLSECFPHFYCNKCSNVIWRSQDRQLVSEKGASEETLKEVLGGLPLCSCGGSFSANANPKCPSCGSEFKHQQTGVQRLTDPHVILLQGATFEST